MVTPLEYFLQLSIKTKLAFNKLFGLIIIDSWVMLYDHYEIFKCGGILLAKLLEKRVKLQQAVFILINLIHEILALSLVLVQIL